eukprot:SAG31_NODE_152_length_22216_cov_16.550029_14_plen_199_part_00
MKKAEGRLQLWQGWEQKHKAEDSWRALQSRLGCRRRQRELAGGKRVYIALEEREDEAMTREANILFELETVEQDAEELRELVADRVAERMVRETTAAAVQTSPPRSVDPSGSASVDPSGSALEEERSVTATAEVGAPVGKKKTRKSKAQERRTARRAALRANMEVQAADVRKVRDEGEEQDGVVGAKDQSRVFDPGGV